MHSQPGSAAEAVHDPCLHHGPRPADETSQARDPPSREPIEPWNPSSNRWFSASLPDDHAPTRLRDAIARTNTSSPDQHPRAAPKFGGGSRARVSPSASLQTATLHARRRNVRLAFAFDCPELPLCSIGSDPSKISRRVHMVTITFGHREWHEICLKIMAISTSWRVRNEPGSGRNTRDQAATCCAKVGRP